MCQNLLVPALDAGPQKDRPYQSDFYRAGFNAIPRQAREQDSFDTPPFLFQSFVNVFGVLAVWPDIGNVDGVFFYIIDDLMIAVFDKGTIVSFVCLKFWLFFSQMGILLQ